jgi:hypothetical protein
MCKIITKDVKNKTTFKVTPTPQGIPKLMNALFVSQLTMVFIKHNMLELCAIEKARAKLVVQYYYYIYGLQWVPFLLRGIHIKFSPLANEFQYAVVPVGNFILLIALFPYVDGCESSGHKVEIAKTRQKQRC